MGVVLGALSIWVRVSLYSRACGGGMMGQFERPGSSREVSVDGPRNKANAPTIQRRLLTRHVNDVNSVARHTAQQSLFGFFPTNSASSIMTVVERVVIVAATQRYFERKGACRATVEEVTEWHDEVYMTMVLACFVHPLGKRWVCTCKAAHTAAVLSMEHIMVVMIWDQKTMDDDDWLTMERRLWCMVASKVHLLLRSLCSIDGEHKTEP